MTERGDRVIAWAAQMRTMHHRLRDALEVTRDELRAAGPAPPPLQELLLYCQGFCAALDGHHRSEDRTFFPGIEAVQIVIDSQ